MRSTTPIASDSQADEHRSKSEASPDPFGTTDGTLRQHLALVPPGAVANAPLDRLLAAEWDGLDGSADGGMQAHKLMGRMEQVRWQPPVLSFRIERHGGTVHGSTRAEMQHWQVDLDRKTAEVVGAGRRQLTRMSKAVDVRPIAEEIAERVLAGDEDDRLRRSADGSVRLIAARVFPDGSGFKQTLAGRRMRLCGEVEKLLSAAGWTCPKRGLFVPAAAAKPK